MACNCDAARIDFGTRAQECKPRADVVQLVVEQLQLHLITPLLPLRFECPVHQHCTIRTLILRQPRASPEQVKANISVARKGWTKDRRSAHVGRWPAAVVEQDGGEW